MPRVEATKLPGIGVIRTFRTSEDDWIGVLELPSGRRQLFVDDPTDPDTRRLVAELDPDDSRLLAELFGAQEPSDEPPSASSPPVDWVLIPPSSPAVGQAVGDLQLRSEVGASIVAVLRERTHTEVTPDFELRAGDIAVLTGGPASLEAAANLLRGANGDD